MEWLLGALGYSVEKHTNLSGNVRKTKFLPHETNTVYLEQVHF